MRLNAIAAVAAINGALALSLGYLWSDAGRVRWTEPSALPPALNDVVSPPASQPADVVRYRETIERPLFAANRRPAPRKDAPAEEQEAAALNDVRLLGTYGAGNMGGIVVVRGGKVERLAIGDSIGGWRLAGAGAGRSAELVRADGQRRQLELALNNAAPAEAGKPGKPDAADAQAAAGQSSAGQPAAGGAASAASQRASTARSRSSWGGAASPEARQQRLDQINQRRAARGQPPLPSQ